MWLVNYSQERVIDSAKKLLVERTVGVHKGVKGKRRRIVGVPDGRFFGAGCAGRDDGCCAGIEGGGTTIVVKRVAETVGERVSHKCPRYPQMRLVATDAALELRSSYIPCNVTYVGSPLIRGMSGFSKLSTSLSTVGAAMVGG